MSEDTQVRAVLAKAVLRVLCPLVRMLLRYGVSYRSAAEWLRWSYVKVATEEFPIPGRRQTKSRVAVITGLTRVDVDRLQKMPPPGQQSEEVEEYQRGARVLSAWARDPDYLDEHGDPLDLPVEAGSPSFSSLVALHAGGAPTRAVMDDLIHVGAVKLRKGVVHMLTPHYVPLSGDQHEAQADILGQSAGGLLSTLAHNTDPATEETWLQGQAYCVDIPVSRASEVRDHIKSRGRDFLYQVDAYLYQMAVQEEQNDAEPTVEIGVGTYLFTESDDSLGN